MMEILRNATQDLFQANPNVAVSSSQTDDSKLDDWIQSLTTGFKADESKLDDRIHSWTRKRKPAAPGRRAVRSKPWAAPWKRTGCGSSQWRGSQDLVLVDFRTRRDLAKAAGTLWDPLHVTGCGGAQEALMRLGRGFGWDCATPFPG